MKPTLSQTNRSLFCLAVFALAGAITTSFASAAERQPPNTLSPAELKAGWLLLFDGKTDYGWKSGSQADWKVVDGTLRVSSGKPGLFCTTTRFADYQLKVDFRSPANTNSGVFLRTPLIPTDPKSDCYELNIAPPDNPFPTGSFVARKKAAAVTPSDQWRSFEVTAVGGKFTVLLDGKEVLSYEDPTPVESGFIGLQLNSGLVEFRNVKLKPLGLQSIFNGKDLTGWNTDGTMQSLFSVNEEGNLHVENGKGQLETTQSYGDFVLQLEGFVNGKSLNSGIFFRCIPGDVMMGYECQIQNGFRNDDRTQPEDCGTGGIFRRQNARLVLPNDFEWFEMTLVAEGPHFSTWVNGTQVCDWTDERPAHENPRKGLRLKPGTIMIQGHDSTTDLSFRNLRIVELPAAK
jgi:hypothetical protein